jgi:hypothetical protein
MKRLVGVIFCGLLLVSAGISDAQNHVGIILSGHEKDCEVTHKGKSAPCSSRKLLYVGDQIMKKPSTKSLKIKWAPFADGKAQGDTLIEVTLRQPDKLSGNRLVSGIKQYMDDFVKPTEYGTIALVTRARPAKMVWPLQATLMQDVPLKVNEPDERIKSITITDGKGQKVYEKTVKGTAPTAISPAEMGMKPQETYALTVHKDVAKRRMDIKLLDNEIQEEIRQGLADIENENDTPSGKVIKKAVYLQLMSDAYPDKIDLYWLSKQLWQDHKTMFSKDQEEIINGLEQRFVQHCRKK